MTYFRYFSRKVALIFIVFSAFLSGLFSVLIWVSIERTDDQVRKDLLQAQSHRLVENFSKSGVVYQKDELVGIKVLLEGRDEIPHKWQILEEGIHEDDEGITHIWKIVLKVKSKYRQVILVHIPINGDVLENNELSVSLSLVLISLLVTIIGSLVGAVLARSLTNPVRELSYKITHTDPNNPIFEPLNRNDEFGEISDAFSKTLLQIKQVMEREKQFSAYVSHELRTPVAVIKSSLELIKACGEQPGLNSFERIQDKALSRMTIATAQMELLIQTFLYLGRNQNTAVINSLINLVPLMEDKIDQYRNDFCSKNIEVSKQIPAQLNIQCNEKVFSLILENMLRNCFSYCSGSITFVLKADGFSVYNDIDQLRIEKAEHFGFGLKIIEDLCLLQGWSFTSGVDSSNKYLTFIEFDRHLNPIND